MAVIIKEMRIRTVVEKRVVTEAELPEEILRKVEDRILDRISKEERIGWPVGKEMSGNNRRRK